MFAVANNLVVSEDVDAVPTNFNYAGNYSNAPGHLRS